MSEKFSKMWLCVKHAGDKEDPNSYRPIAVLPAIARVFEKLIYGELYNYFIKNNLLGNKQFGFRSLHSTALALGKSVNHWLMNIDNGKMNSVVFLDIKKAFDTINHEILLQKLSCYDIKDLELMFFQSYLYNRTQSCNINGKMSIQQTSYIWCTTGLKTGSTTVHIIYE